jgi:hypothetical protein
MVAVPAAMVFITAAARIRLVACSAMPAMVIGRFRGAIPLPVFTAIFVAARLARLAGSSLGARQRPEDCRDGGDEKPVLHEQISEMTW